MYGCMGYSERAKSQKIVDGEPGIHKVTLSSPFHIVQFCHVGLMDSFSKWWKSKYVEQLYFWTSLGCV